MGVHELNVLEKFSLKKVTLRLGCASAGNACLARMKLCIQSLALCKTGTHSNTHLQVEAAKKDNQAILSYVESSRTARVL